MEKVTGYDERWKELDAYLRRLMDERFAPGVAALVQDAGGILFSRTLGMRETGPRRLPLEPDTLFDLASLTKTLGITTASALLQEAGELDYEAPLERFFEDPGAFGKVSVRQLLTHTGGFIPTARLDLAVEEPGRALPFILRGPPAYAPGTAELYSCFGFIVLGAVLEKVCGLPLDRLISKLVLQPLGMTETCYRPLDRFADRPAGFAATEYDEVSGKMLSGMVHDENARFLRGVSGNAGLFSTVPDMSKWTGMLAASGRLPDGSAFLRPETIRSFYTDFTAGMEEHRGIGFKLYPELSGGPAYGHTGYTGTSILIEPERGLGFILFTNRVHPCRKEQRLVDERLSIYRTVLDCFDCAKVCT